MIFKEPKRVTNGKVLTYENRKLINLKGSGAIDTSKDPKIRTKNDDDPLAWQPATLYDPQATQTQWHMRKFVNKRTAAGYFAELEKILDANAELFANGLINLVLKKDLDKKLTKNPLLMYDFWFGFALVTAVGSVSTSGNVNIGTGSSKDIKTVGQALNTLDKSPSKIYYCKG